jgi:hypothetical protein
MNWFGLAAGVLMLVVVALSIFTPWWKLQIGSGSGFVTVNANPFYTNFSVLSLYFVIPILFAINIASIALFIASGVIFIIYSVKPTESYSKHLLSYGWKRPLYTVIGFMVVIVVTLYVVPIIINMVAGSSMVPSPMVPLMGSSVLQLSTSMFGSSIQIGVPVITTFEYTFYLGVVSAVLGIVARVYHGRIVSDAVIPPPAAVTTPTPASASQPT